MPKHTVRMNASGTKAKGKYVVEIDHGEEEGRLKRIKFRDGDAAIKFANALGKGKSKARVLSPDGQQIYPYQQRQAEGFLERSPSLSNGTKEKNQWHR